MAETVQTTWGKALHYADTGEQGLQADLYELTMAAAYFDHRMSRLATFSLFVREYPPDRSYFVAAGLQEVIRFLTHVRFTDDDLRYLRDTGLFKEPFLDYLAGFRFTGDVRAIPEGRLFFVNEPVLEVSAPIIEAQVVETFIINAVSLQTLIATKASRSLYAARGRACVDFSLRRTQGFEAGLKVARASYIGGFVSTSNVMAGKAFGIPVAGTMAHSFVEAFPQEIDAFRAFAETFPHNTTLLIDTYDTVQGARKAAQVGKEMEQRGARLNAVRIDSGDMVALAKEVRRVMDAEGLSYVRIIASGGIDEHKVQHIVAEGAPVDGFGIGTKMGVSADQPWLDIAYKLVKYDGRPVMKLSAGKVTLVDEKQVYRIRDVSGRFQHDIIALRGEPSPAPDAEPLLDTVMSGGRPTMEEPALAVARETFLRDFAALGDPHKALTNAPPYAVHVSPPLQALQQRVVQEIRQKELGE